MKRFPKINAHAMGNWQDKIYTNSREAFESSYRAGVRSFEVDVNDARDGVFVISHDRMRLREQTHLEFKEDRLVGIHGDYPLFLIEGGTPLTLEDLFDLMDQYPDVTFMFDFQPATWGGVLGKDPITILHEFCQCFTRPSFRARSLIEIPISEALVQIVQSYGLTPMLWVGENELNNAVAVISRLGIHYVSVAHQALTCGWVEKLHELGVCVYAASADRFSDYLWAREICVDYITVHHTSRYRNLLIFFSSFIGRMCVLLVQRMMRTVAPPPGIVK